MNIRRTAVPLAGISLVAASTAGAAEPPTITAAQAGEYVGKRVKVCGEIAAVGRALTLTGWPN